MSKQSTDPYNYKPSSDGITFLPLGGCGQFGANFNLYGYDDQWIIVDCGIAFADQALPGVDILLPDPSFIASRKEKLKGLILTHAHEDHIGAVARLWPFLKCPIYASPFAACVLRRKFSEYPPKDSKVEIIEFNSSITLEPFHIEPVPVAHSIPEAFALAITCHDVGTVLHSGDWNLDPTPVIGEPTPEHKFQELGKKGVLAYIGDSTNASVDGYSKSESAVEQGFNNLFRHCKGRIAVTIFSSNVARIINIYRAATAVGRKVCVSGRSLLNMIDNARQCGYIDDTLTFISENQAAETNSDQVVYIVTGSQGEGRAALSKIAHRSHPRIKLGKKDTVFFSARSIPGNEREIIDMKNLLLEQGISVVDPDNTSEVIHVSGHPRKNEIEQMLSWVRPESLIAVHGERLQQAAHANLHKDSIVPENGQIMLIKRDGKVKTLGYIDSRLQVVDFDRIVDLDHAAVSQRRKMSFNGVVMISLVYDVVDDDILDLQITTLGLFDTDLKKDQDHFNDLESHIDRTITKMPTKDRRTETMLEKKIRSYAKRYFRELFNIRPLIEIHITLLD